MNTPSNNETCLFISGEELGELISPLLRDGRCCRFVSGGSSMLPFIRNRDCITIAPLKGQTPAMGDVLAYFHPVSSTVIVHRVIGKKKGSFLMKGDNCRSPDGVISPDHICGILVKIERGSRTIGLGMGLEKKVIALMSRHDPLMRLVIALLKVKNRLITKR
ncbi:MAG: S24/S26 family peptidase [Proteobacteria bacterium]|nr:S24/S26 family peptidase [Pseudomonadota bacterium]